MNIAIMKPYTFPYIVYFQLIYAVDKFIFMNIYFTKKEMSVNFSWFLRPFYPPLILSIFLVISVNFLIQLLPDFNNFVALFIKGSSFTFSFFTIAYILKFESFNLIISEVKLILKKK